MQRNERISVGVSMFESSCAVGLWEAGHSSAPMGLTRSLPTAGLALDRPRPIIVLVFMA